MAISTNNVLLAGVRGKVGGMFVVRQRNGKTVICKLPRPYEKPPTSGQLANRERFKNANTYAKAAIKDPEKKKYYQSRAKNGQSAFNAAFKDAFHGGAALETDIQTTGRKVSVSVTEKRGRFTTAFKPVPARLQGVTFRLLHTSGYEEEKGAAVFSKQRQRWEHTFRGTVTPGHILAITLTDWLGHTRQYLHPYGRAQGKAVDAGRQ